MPGCVKRCTDFRTDTRDNAWLDIRDHFGPRVGIAHAVYTSDMDAWNAWAVAHSVDPMNIVRFGKWLIWKCSFGTDNNGNLPTRLRDHTGISCILCPYDEESDAIRTRLWLGLEDIDPIPTQSDHDTYYMRVAQRGNQWGFECTDPNCPFFLSNGTRYFHA